MSYKINEKCSWCGKKADLISHHYPKSNKDGGKEVIDICLNCHRTFHIGVMVDARSCKNEKEINRKICISLKKAFPKLDSIVNPNLIIFNPIWKWKT